MAGLAQAVVAQRPPGPLDGGRHVSLGLGERGEPLERPHEALAPGVLGLDRPVVGHLGQEGPRRELDRPLEGRPVPGGQQPLGLLRVDPPRQVGRDARAGPVGDQVLAPADRLQRRAHAPEGAAQRRAGAGVEHVGPEDPGDAGPRLEPGPGQQVGEQRPRLHAGHVRDGAAVDLDGETSEEPGAQHARHLRRPRGGGQSGAEYRGPAIGEGTADPPGASIVRVS